jgi:hypothetical protein
VLYEASIIRALRPLARTRPSRRAWQLDEAATAGYTAETGVLVPRWHPAAVRPFDVVLIIDRGATMVPWSGLATQFCELLRRQGAFRDVRVVWLDSDNPAPQRYSVRGLNGTTEHGLAELIRPTNSRMILVLTDGMGVAWRRGAMSVWLRRFGGVGPLAVINPLPHRLWQKSALSYRRMRLTAQDGGMPNGQLRCRLVVEDPFDTDRPRNAMPLPVLELDGRWLRRWAELVGSSGPRTVDLPVCLIGGEPAEFDVELSDPEPTPIERVLAFRRTASPHAFTLAGVFAAAPLHLPLMRTLQVALVPESTTAHLAEFLVSGLIHRVGTADDYEFVQPELRALLLSGARRDRTVRVVRLTAALSADMPPDDVDRVVWTALSARSQGVSSRAELTATSPGKPLTTLTPPELASLSPWPNPGPQVVWGEVPPFGTGVVNRAELSTQIRASVAQPTGSPSIVVLHGPAGAGKTWLAVRYAHDFADDYDLVWWIPAMDTAAITRSVCTLAARLGRDDEPTLADLLTVIPRWLLVFDDAVDSDELAPFLPDGDGHILVTSTNPKWTDNTHLVPVGGFTVNEARVPFQDATHVAQADVDRIAAALDRQPLAVCMAAGYLAATATPAEEYLDLLDSGLVPSDLALDVVDRVTWRSVGVSADGPLPMADIPIDVLRLLDRHRLAWLDHRHRTVWPHPSVSVVLRCQPDSPRTDPVVHREWDHRAQLADELRIGGDYVGARDHDKRVRQDAEKLFGANDPVTIRAAGMLSADLLLTADYWAAHELMTDTLARTRGLYGDDHPDTLLAIVRLAVVTRLLGRPAEARGLNAQALDMLHAVLGGDDPLTLACAVNLGNDLHAVGEHNRALSLDQQTESMAVIHLGMDDPVTLSIRLNRMLDLNRTDENGLAALIADYVRVLGPDHPSTAAARSGTRADVVPAGSG